MDMPIIMGLVKSIEMVQHRIKTRQNLIKELEEIIKNAEDTVHEKMGLIRRYKDRIKKPETVMYITSWIKHYTYMKEKEEASVQEIQGSVQEIRDDIKDSKFLIEKYKKLIEDTKHYMENNEQFRLREPTMNEYLLIEDEVFKRIVSRLNEFV